MLLVAGGRGTPHAGPPAGRKARPRRPVPPGVLTLVAGKAVVLRIGTGRYLHAGRLQRTTLTRTITAALPSTSTVTTGRVQLTYRWDPRATVALAVARGSQGGRIQAVRHVIASRIQAPVRQQLQANTCESAALSILLSTVGRSVTEGQIQRALPTSGARDPQGAGPGRIWGDPDRGYVGRPDGGGVAGGFGVYPGPIILTAARFGVRLRNLSGQPIAAVYRSLLQGHAVMAWIGLSNGPFDSWTSPQGRPITVNFGEHTVVLDGIRADGSVLVSNPLEGTREIWTATGFAQRWALLGHRAVST